MSLKYEPASEPLHICVKWLYLVDLGLGEDERDTPGRHALSQALLVQGLGFRV